MVTFTLNRQSFSVTRPKLREWLSLEDKRSKSLERAEKGEDEFVTEMFSYLSALLDVSEDKLIQAPWYEVIEAFYLVSVECAPRLGLTILQQGSTKTKVDKLPDPWEYKERLWYSWLHTLAKAYGWNVEYISQLDVDDAFALVQEISLDEQFSKEWEWSISDVAYEFDKSTKKSRLRALPRPDWMRRASKTYQDSITKPKSVPRINPAFIPPGVIVYDEPKTTASKHERNPGSV